MQKVLKLRAKLLHYLLGNFLIKICKNSFVKHKGCLLDIRSIPKNSLKSLYI